MMVSYQSVIEHERISELRDRQFKNRKNGFSFIVKGLKIAEIKLDSGGFVLTLIQNILNPGYTSVHQQKKEFVYSGSGNPPVSEADLRNHFIAEAKNLIALRKNNTIGYREKWLRSLLIEKMQEGSLHQPDPVRSEVGHFCSFGCVGMFQNTPFQEKSHHLNDIFNTDR